MEEAFRFNNPKQRNDYYRQKNGGDATSDNLPDAISRLKVTGEQMTDPATKRGVHNIYIYNLEPEDVQKIIAALKGDKDTYSVYTSRQKKGTLALRIFDDNMASWMNNALKTIQNILAESGNYNENEINDLPGQLNNVNMSKQEIQAGYAESEKKAIDVWLAYLENINSPEVKKKLEAYQRIYKYLDVKYGHVKSAKNVAAILATDSTATFILTAAEWRDFNRIVKPNARKFYVLVPLVNEVDKSKIDKVIEKCGWGGTAYNDLPFQVQQLVDMKCQELGVTPPFATYLEFDIADTILIPGKEDIFNTQIGLANNLTGELNDKAKEHYNSVRGDEELPKDVEMEERTKKAAEFIIGFCKKNNVPLQITDDESASSILVKGLVAYYQSVAEQDANIDKDTNKTIFAKNATLFTLIIANLALDRLSNFAHPVTYSKQEGAEFMKSVTYVLNRLEPALALQPQAVEITESIQIPGHTKEELLQQFRQFCKQYGIKIV